jgi:hypothetical protein
MELLRRICGVKGLSSVASLLPLGKGAWERVCATCFLLVWPHISKRSWDASFGGLTQRSAHALDMAILVVGLPPAFFFIGLFLYIRRRSSAWRSEQDASSDTDSGSPEQASNRTGA